MLKYTKIIQFYENYTLPEFRIVCKVQLKRGDVEKIENSQNTGNDDTLLNRLMRICM